MRFWSTLPIALLAAAPQAAVVTDGTFGPAVALGGPEFIVGEALGSRVGENLFHSFSRFDIAQGESANFTGSAGIAHLIGRVTGGEPSTIDGVLRSTVEGADLWLLNPAGVLFGPHAFIDLPASFHVGAATEIRFTDGAGLNTDSPPAALTIAPPAAFGFLGGSGGPVELHGTALLPAPGGGLDMAGAELRIEGGVLMTESGTITLAATGDIRIASGSAITSATYGEGDGGAIEIRTPGRIALQSGSALRSYSRGEAGPIRGGAPGAIRIQAGELEIDGAGTDAFTGILSYASEIPGGQPGAIDASSMPSYGSDPGAIELEVAGALRIRNGALVYSVTDVHDPAADISIRAGSLEIDGGARAGGILSETQASQGASLASGFGAGGGIALEIGGPLTIVRGGAIATGTGSDGAAGAIRVEAESLILDRMGAGELTGIVSRAFAGGGSAGDIEVALAGTGTIRDGATVSSVTHSAGDAGAVRFSAAALSADGAGSGFATGIQSETYSAYGGDSGSVWVSVAGAVELRQGATIAASSLFSDGDGGTVEVEAGSIFIDGVEDDAGFTGIGAFTYWGTGQGGDIRVAAGTVELRDGGGIATNAILSGGGAGSIGLTADELLIVGEIDDQFLMQFTGVASETYNSEGDAGRIDIRVRGTTALLEGGEITTSSSVADGDAGSIRIETGRLLVERGDSPIRSAISSQADPLSSGQVGDIRIAAGEVVLREGGQIGIAALGEPRAGAPAEGHEIVIEAGRIELSGGAEITAESAGSAPAAAIHLASREGVLLLEGSALTTETLHSDGGAIRIDGAPLLLRDSLITTSVAGASGDGGAITLQTAGLALDSGFIQANTAAAGGTGGQIRIGAPAIVTAEGQPLRIGGDDRLQFVPESGKNVIQAAAPDGVSGEIQLANPEVAPPEALSGLGGEPRPLSRIAANPCRVRPGQRPSSLTAQGWGGRPAIGETAAVCGP